MTYFCPALDPPLNGSGRKTTTLVRDLKYFIHTKFHQNPSSGSGEEVENVNSLTDDRRTTDGRTTDYGQRVITIGHWSLWLLCPKKGIVLFSEGTGRVLSKKISNNLFENLIQMANFPIVYSLLFHDLCTLKYSCIRSRFSIRNSTRINYKQISE